MTKCIILKYPDLSIQIIEPNPIKYGDDEGKLPWTECKAFKHFEHLNLPYSIVDKANILQIKKNTESPEQLYWNGDEIKVDESWEIKLMPESLIKKKHILRISNKIEKEISKQNPDLLKLFKYKIEKENFSKLSKDKVYKQALINMDEDGINKPVIRQKILEKIGE